MRRPWVAVAALTLALTASAASTASVAVDWRADVPLTRSNKGTFAVDASYRDRLSVIAWQVAGDATGDLSLATLLDAGRGTFDTRQLADDVVGMAVAACGRNAFVAYRERQGDGRLRLRLARVPSDGGAVARVTVRQSVPARGTLDMACGSGRATVAWTERVASTWHVLVRHARLDDLARTPVRDLGEGHRVRVATAASGDLAYVAWSDATGLRLKRFVVGDGPGFEVATRPTQRLASDGRAPMVAADGSEVAVGYSSGTYAWIVSSRDGGRTFPDGTGYAVTPGDASPTSIALAGSRGVATVRLTSGDHVPLFHRLLRTRPGGTWTGRSAGQGVVEPHDGFLVTSTGTKLAETFSRRDGDTGGWEIVFRRER